MFHSLNISVIIPLYNAEKYIKKAIESCLQLPEVKEIVVVDDGYKDCAKEIVTELAIKYPLIKLYEHPDNANQGAGPSRNLGIEKATQEYIAFLDADDFFLPNRFEKDRQVFSKNPHAEGCYNAVGSYFYSETAKEEFLAIPGYKEITTVNLEVKPTPENLFRRGLGIIPNYGYFSIDGLTVNRNSLLKYNILFPALTIHQDSVFIVKLAYYCRLYPSELINPVALRGVHEENRIISNYQSEKYKQYNNRLKMWANIQIWASSENLKKSELKFIRYQSTVFELLLSSHPTPNKLFMFILTHIRILFSSYYQELHLKHFGKSVISTLLLNIRNKLTAPIIKRYKGLK